MEHHVKDGMNNIHTFIIGKIRYHGSVIYVQNSKFKGLFCYEGHWRITKHIRTFKYYNYDKNFRICFIHLHCESFLLRYNQEYILFVCQQLGSLMIPFLTSFMCHIDKQNLQCVCQRVGELLCYPCNIQAPARDRPIIIGNNTAV